MLTVRLDTMQPAPDRGYAVEPWLRLLDDEERDRASRFHFARDRWSYVAAHALLRTALSEAVEGRTAPAAWRFRLGPYGRPEIDEALHGGTGLRFSLSHTHDLAGSALLVVGPSGAEVGAEIGLDAERIDREIDFEALARRFFEPGEAAAIEALPEAERRLAFFRTWTAKEALVKALGRGLSQDLSSFCCRLEPPGLAWAVEAFRPLEEWELTRPLETATHVATLAVRRPVGLAVLYEVRERTADFAAGPSTA